MKLHILSDLHNEFDEYQPANVEADVVILAGDIDVKGRAIDWAKQQFPDTPVVYVMGNHEYYKSAWPKQLDEMRTQSAKSLVHVMDNDHIKIEGVNFLGCTLWTDFNLFGSAHVDGYQAGTSMNDYKKIRVSPRFRRLTPNDTVRLHRQSLAWLKDKAKEFAGEPVVIVTHHAPSAKSLPAHAIDDDLSTAYASNLEDFVATSQARLWVHGHIHSSVDYVVGHTRVMCNPRGYPDEDTGFNSNLIIEV